jgi:antitoxin (DNA-binding transcriptional repressor) of toxin-antitoxin stability system
MTATEAARHFSELLTAIERDHETVEITRGGRLIAKISPASAGNGADLLRLLREHPVDETFADDVRTTRGLLIETDPEWHD